MLEVKDLVGKSLSLVLVSDDEGSAVVTGTVQLDGEELLFEYDGDPSSFRLPDDALERIKPVPEEVSEILNGAAYVLPLSVGNLPEDAGSDGVEPTGLKWPEE